MTQHQSKRLRLRFGFTPEQAEAIAPLAFGGGDD